MGSNEPVAALPVASRLNRCVLVLMSVYALSSSLLSVRGCASVPYQVLAWGFVPAYWLAVAGSWGTLARGGLDRRAHRWLLVEMAILVSTGPLVGVLHRRCFSD